MKKAASAVAALVFAAVIGFGAGTASAFTPTLTGNAVCLDNGFWQVTWTITSSTPGNTWQVNSPDGYTPAGQQSSDNPFVRVATYPVAETSATETIDVTWFNSVGTVG